MFTRAERWPRGLQLAEAADYIGFGRTKFSEMVADGRMPKPKLVDSCVRWDRFALDEYFDRLPDQEKKLDRSRWKDVRL
jgi:predicted DNA-binding transcriptional regulator AlpA